MRSSLSSVRWLAPHRVVWILFIVMGCGDDTAAVPDAPGGSPDTSRTCLPQSAVGIFYRRQPNPRLIAGSQTFTDAKLDTAIADPDLRWDDGTQSWHVYYQSPHSTSFSGAPGPMVIRHATSTNLAAWALDDAPSLAAATDSAAWDYTHVEAPSVVYNPNAPADRRYLMMYSGAANAFPYSGSNYPTTQYAIGAAFSADGKTFTRVPAAESPHAKAGQVFKGSDAHSGSLAAMVSDPDVVLVGSTYHLWFSSFACEAANCATVKAKGIGHATSTDGVRWMLDAAPVVSLLRASADLKTGGSQPSVIYDDVYCRWEMWLTNDSPATENDNQPTELSNMVGLWYATSTNGTSWSINYSFARDFIWDGTAAGERLGLRTGADIARKSNGRYMVYVGYDDQNVPSGSTLPTRTSPQAGVMTLNVATRDAQ